MVLGSPLIIPRFLRQAKSAFTHQTTPPVARSPCRGKLGVLRISLLALIVLYRSFVANSNSEWNVRRPSTTREILIKLA